MTKKCYKEQGKNLKDQINEDRIGNLHEKVFTVMIVKKRNLARGGEEGGTGRSRKGRKQ